MATRQNRLVSLTDKQWALIQDSLKKNHGAFRQRVLGDYSPPGFNRLVLDADFAAALNALSGQVLEPGRIKDIDTLDPAKVP